MSHSVTIIMALVLVFGTYCLAAVVAQGSATQVTWLKATYYLRSLDGSNYWDDDVHDNVLLVRWAVGPELNSSVSGYVVSLSLEGSGGGEDCEDTTTEDSFSGSSLANVAASVRHARRTTREIQTDAPATSTSTATSAKPRCRPSLNDFWRSCSENWTDSDSFAAEEQKSSIGRGRPAPPPPSVARPPLPRPAPLTAARTPAHAPPRPRRHRRKGAAARSTAATAASPTAQVRDRAQSQPVIFQCASCEAEPRRPTRIPFRGDNGDPWRSFCGENEMRYDTSYEDTTSFNYPMLKCLKTTDGNTVRFDIDQTLEDPHFQLDVWEVRGEDIAYPIVDSEDFVPFRSRPLDGYIARARPTQAELVWKVEDAPAVASFNITVLCLCYSSGTTDIFVLEVSSADKTATVLLSDLNPGAEYICRAKFTAGISESMCSDGVIVTTLQYTPGGCLKDVTLADGVLRWEDPFNDLFTTHYYINATRKQRQPSCCTSPTQTLLFVSNSPCCAGLDELLPSGTAFFLKVKTVQQNNNTVFLQSESVDYETPEREGPSPPADFSLSATPSPNNTDPLQVKLCPPCEAHGDVHDFIFSADKPDLRKRIHDVDMTVDKMTGILSLNFSQLFPTFNWCQCDGQNVTFQVTAANAKLNKVSQPLNLTVFVPHQCPTPPAAEDLSDRMQLIYGDGTATTAVLTIRERLFDWSMGRPRAYRLLVAQKGEESMGGGCGASNDTIHIWAIANQYPRVALYSPTDRGWNLFQDPSCDASGTCSYSYTIGKDQCPLYETNTFCNGPLRAGTTYMICLRAQYDSEGLFYIETPPLYLSGMAWCAT
ncbi:uncharacterized protein LOC113218051 isoform X2 [Frankliniella occidentalis]|uniref:Uncharacterized protein LOC113218051 isoform X2 n=1 Tax=Frankliniella occidentalis TaxID=133901 RepID=A0A9C6WVG2_FRAOC|nr:uncharacterized protein LOC113218051 isoform X2 [Frankliniella occidentalis]